MHLALPTNSSTAPGAAALSTTISGEAFNVKRMVEAAGCGAERKYCRAELPACGRQRTGCRPPRLAAGSAAAGALSTAVIGNSNPALNVIVLDTVQSCRRPMSSMLLHLCFKGAQSHCAITLASGHFVHAAEKRYRVSARRMSAGKGSTHVYAT